MNIYTYAAWFCTAIHMRIRTLTIALVSALLVAGAGGALAATESVQAQQATTTTNATTGSAGMTTNTGTNTAAGTSSAAGTSTAAGESATTAGSSGPSITFEDQNGSGESVSVRSATLPQKGFVVINGTPNGSQQVLGASYLLDAGTSDNVRIELDQPVSESQSLTAVLYADSNGNGQFDAPSAKGQSDKPIYEGDSQNRVVDIAEISVRGASDAGTGTSGNATTSAENGTSAATQTASSDAGTTAAANESGGASNASSGNESDGAGNGSNGNESGGSGAGGPGFGPVVAVIALLAVALFARRRN